jgi:hypothetical protein
MQRNKCAAFDKQRAVCYNSKQQWVWRLISLPWGRRSDDKKKGDRNSQIRVSASDEPSVSTDDHSRRFFGLNRLLHFNN